MTADEAIAIVESKARGRTRYEGQEPFVDEVLVAEIRKLREALKAVIPPARGLFGGPLIGCKAIYEDGTNEDTKRHRGWIDHADYRRARAALADGEKE